MPRKAKYVALDSRKRFRITVELDAVSAAILEREISELANFNVTISISQLVRYAIAYCDKWDGFDQVVPETLQSVRARQQLRAQTKPNPEPTENT